MKTLIYISAALIGYLVAGWNPAITFSKAIYKKDIRECGSGNPGFTNFRRSFGNSWAWWVLLLDLSKAALAVALFSHLLAQNGVDRQFAAAYTGLFCMLGHVYPVWYGFKGGKGFLVCMSIIWFIDPRAGLVALVLMLILLFTTKYMSIATVAAMLTCPIVLLVLDTPVSVVCIYGACVLFMAIRHKENFKRLKNGTESKFKVRTKA